MKLARKPTRKMMRDWCERRGNMLGTWYTFTMAGREEGIV
jgi:hypothetical protein